MSETVVTTYVTRVQEERQTARWTLTEWLRIKERMKMMDVWLAMFSDPKKDQFQPELNLSFAKSRGVLRYNAVDRSEDDHGRVSGTHARAQLWLTNVFTGTTGVRMLNIDFGMEAAFRKNADYEAETEVSYANKRSLLSTYYSGNFRIFGKNIQDSSLVVKVGQYSLRHSVANLDGENSRALRRGLMLGGEVQLYIFKWLGTEANYLDFQKGDADESHWSTKGHYYDYGGYIEVSLLRLYGGVYQEKWEFDSEGDRASTDEDGYFAGVKLQL